MAEADAIIKVEPSEDMKAFAEELRALIKDLRGDISTLDGHIRRVVREELVDYEKQLVNRIQQRGNVNG